MTNMKKLLLLISLFVGLAFSSCENVLDYNGPTKEQINLAKVSDISAYSNGIFLGDLKYSTDMNANMWADSWNCENANKELTNEDIANIKELLSKGVPTYNNVILPWENYFVEQVYKGQAPSEAYTPTDINGNPVSGTTITGSNQMDKLVAYNENITNTNYGGYWDAELNEYVQIITEDHYEHVNNFNNGNNTNTPGQDKCGETHSGVTLMTNMSTEGITANNQFGFHESYGTSHNYNNYIIVQYKGEWYVGFDYEMHKNEAQNANEAKDVERDWNFTDWIVRISPAYHEGETPEDPIIVGGEDPENPGDEDGDIVENATPEHVEINLEVEEHDSWLASHLSIHVRANTNVTVFLPIEAKHYCEADDLLIVQKHLDNFMVHGGPEKLEWDIDGHIVSVTIDHQENGIYVSTSGITQEVLDYVYGITGDGLTFEIWNYYNGDPIEDRESIREILNGSTVEFENNPKLYVNAFYYDDNSKDINPWDCNVTPNAEYFTYNNKHKWFNSSPHNDFYIKK